MTSAYVIHAQSIGGCSVGCCSSCWGCWSSSMAASWCSSCPQSTSGCGSGGGLRGHSGWCWGSSCKWWSSTNASQRAASSRGVTVAEAGSDPATHQKIGPSPLHRLHWGSGVGSCSCCSLLELTEDITIGSLGSGSYCLGCRWRWGETGKLKNWRISRNSAALPRLLLLRHRRFCSFLLSCSLTGL